MALSLNVPFQDSRRSQDLLNFLCTSEVKSCRRTFDRSRSFHHKTSIPVLCCGKVKASALGCSKCIKTFTKRKKNCLRPPGTSSMLFKLLSFNGKVEKRMAQWSLINRGVPQVSILQIELGFQGKYFPADQLTAFHWITGLRLQTFLRFFFK